MLLLTPGVEMVPLDLTDLAATLTGGWTDSDAMVDAFCSAAVSASRPCFTMQTPSDMTTSPVAS